MYMHFLASDSSPVDGHSPTVFTCALGPHPDGVISTPASCTAPTLPVASSSRLE